MSAPRRTKKNNRFLSLALTRRHAPASDLLATMPVSENTRLAFLAYFVTHIPATILIDSQVVLPKSIVPAFAQNLLQWHIDVNEDALMAEKPRWLVGLVTCELLFQLPFFFVAARAIMERRNDLRGYFIAYGAHTATTLVPILQYFYESTRISDAAKMKLIGIYAPYLVVPLWIVWVMIKHDKPFAKKLTRSASRHKQAPRLERRSSVRSRSKKR